MKKIIIILLCVLSSSISYSQQLQDNYCTFLEIILNDTRLMKILNINVEHLDTIRIVDQENILNKCSVIKIGKVKKCLKIFSDLPMYTNNYFILIAISQNDREHALEIAYSDLKCVTGIFKMRNNKWALYDYMYGRVN